MCDECSVQGTEPSCPRCRSLSGSDGFAFTRDTFDFSSLWDHAFNAFRREWVMLSVAVVIFFGIVMAGGMVVNVINSVVMSLLGVKADPAQPFTLVRQFAISALLSQTIGFAVNLVIQGVAVLGLYRVVLDVLIGKPADLARFFSQISRLGRYVVANLLLFVLVTLPLLLVVAGFIALAVFAIGFESLREASFETLPGLLLNPVVVGSTLLAVPVMLIYSAVVLPLSLFVPAEILVSDASPTEAIARVWNLASGHRLAVVGYTLAGGLVTLVGIFACCIGVVPALGLTYLLTLSLFLALRASPDFPAAEHG